jgi:2-polyprenyl-3-methyl-5-hydroxy-6-metoxy-1,4-benzoquinol methylase
MIFYRWHPEVAIRYLPIVREIRGIGGIREPSVLEVGSGGLGIAPYLGRKVVGLDIKFTQPVHPLLTTKIGKAEQIPYPDKSFEVVMAVDVLEHLSKEKREKVVKEMKRVAKKEIIIAVPTGKLAQEQDKQLALEYQKRNHKDFPFFTDHQKCGLPEVEEIANMLEANVRIEENEPLALREFLMRGWMNQNFLAKIFYWKFLLLFIWAFKFFDRPPYYRTIFYVKNWN